MTVGKTTFAAFNPSTLRDDGRIRTHLWHCMELKNVSGIRVRSGCATSFGEQNADILGVLKGADRNRQGLPL
jgi:hypothetical protein